jgi:hypothetical protein
LLVVVTVNETLVVAWRGPVDANAPKLMEPKTAASKIVMVTKDGGFKALCPKHRESAKINLTARRRKLLLFCQTLYLEG